MKTIISILLLCLVTVGICSPSRSQSDVPFKFSNAGILFDDAGEMARVFGAKLLAGPEETEISILVQITEHMLENPRSYQSFQTGPYNIGVRVNNPLPQFRSNEEGPPRSVSDTEGIWLEGSLHLEFSTRDTDRRLLRYFVELPSEIFRPLTSTSFVFTEEWRLEDFPQIPEE